MALVYRGKLCLDLLNNLFAGALLPPTPTRPSTWFPWGITISIHYKTPGHGGGGRGKILLTFLSLNMYWFPNSRFGKMRSCRVIYSVIHCSFNPPFLRAYEVLGTRLGSKGTTVLFSSSSTSVRCGLHVTFSNLIYLIHQQRNDRINFRY